VRFQAASDQALLVYLGEEIGAAAHGRVVRLLRALHKNRPVWIQNIQPAYCSLLIAFDATQVDHDEVRAKISEYEKIAEEIPAAKARLVEIPVCYGGDLGPDLEEVAAKRGLMPAKVIALHCAGMYHAYFLGFAPGFAYLGDVAKEIAMPRLETPRKEVAAGSIGIAGRQTAVYPFGTPGGWRLIGRTPLEIFRKDRQPMELIAIGDQVKFRPISREEFSWSSRA
jgi:inhibitor of KinA